MRRPDGEQRLFTYQAAMPVGLLAHTALSACADLHGRAQCKLFAALRRSEAERNALKREFCRQFGLTARQYNAIRVGLEGKIASIQERRPELIAEAEARIARAEKTIRKIERWLADLVDPRAAFKAGRTVKTMTDLERREAIRRAQTRLHQKKRRRQRLRDRLAAMKRDHEAGTIRLCFGSKKRFRAQFDLKANGYASLDEWRRGWRAARASQFLVLGSGDETAGNQTCQATVAEDGGLTLKLRLPDALVEEYGAHLELPGIRFAYGHEQIVEALASSRRVKSTTKHGNSTLKRVGTALSYRFLRDDKGWRVFVSVGVTAKERVTSRLAGALGVDINADHLAVTRIDRFGNWAESLRFETPTYGKSADRVKAILGDAANTIAEMAKAYGVPIVHERLDFAKRKAELEGADSQQARMLSSFAYGKALSMLDAACFRAGVEVIEVNPAFTSVIGAVNFAQALGISTHQAAALAIARRGLGMTERPRGATQQNSTSNGPSAKTPEGVRTATVPCRDGGHVTLVLPVRNRTRHVWSQWSRIRSALKAAHVARSRSGLPRGRPAPLRHASPASRAHRDLPAQLRHASGQHCSGHALGPPQVQNRE